MTLMEESRDSSPSSSSRVDAPPKNKPGAQEWWFRKGIFCSWGFVFHFHAGGFLIWLLNTFQSLESCHHFGIGGKHCMLEASGNFPVWGVSFRPPFTRAHKAVANFARLEFRGCRNMACCSKCVNIYSSFMFFWGCFQRSPVWWGKYFEIGDYVTVLNGDHAGDAGHVEQAQRFRWLERGKGRHSQTGRLRLSIRSLKSHLVTFVSHLSC